VDRLVLGWIRFDSTGAKDTVGIGTRSLSPGQRIQMEEALSSAVVSTPGRKSGTNIFNGDERGPAVRRLARVEDCRPEIRNQEMLSKGMEEAGRQLGLRDRRQAILEPRYWRTARWAMSECIAALVIQVSTLRPPRCFVQRYSLPR